MVKSEEAQELQTSSMKKLDELSYDACAVTTDRAAVCEEIEPHTKSCSAVTSALRRCSAQTDDDALPSTSSSVSSSRVPGFAGNLWSSGRDVVSHNVPVTSGRSRRVFSEDWRRSLAVDFVCVLYPRPKRGAREKSAHHSSSDIASTSFAETNSDDKSAIPTLCLTAPSAVGDGTSAIASETKKRRFTKVASKSDSSSASPQPRSVAPTALEADASNGAGHTNLRTRAVRKPVRFDDEDSPCNKKRKAKARSSAAPRKSSPVASDDELEVTWCKDCRKRLKPSEVVLFEYFRGDSEGAVEEVLAIIDPRLTSSLCTEDDLAQQPQFKITNFTVYDKHGHVCPFDGGLIDADVSLYLSGHVKSICADDPGLQDSVAVARAGPVVSWWTTGYDGGAQYEPYIKRMEEMMYLVRGILEKLIQSSGDVSFNDVMHHLETLEDLPSDVGPFTLENLHRHSQFVVDHVQAYDSGRRCRRRHAATG
ncbi:hypothetical protein MTO96_024256 [Rhipicephalus appendiculatus]